MGGTVVVVRLGIVRASRPPPTHMMFLRVMSDTDHGSCVHLKPLLVVDRLMPAVGDRKQTYTLLFTGHSLAV